LTAQQIAPARKLIDEGERRENGGASECQPGHPLPGACRL